MSTKAHNKNTSDSPSSSLKSDAEALKLKSDEAADLLSAMSNAKRLLILCNLVEGEMPVGQLAETVGLSQSALSQHLAKLRARKLVSTRRDAQTIYYSIASESVYQVLETIGDIFLSSRPTRMAQATAKPATVG
ncbi:metalloregulator ArsR/SmtB family transcription factor [Rhizobium sp. EC-SD404]|uniref:ArsR/SmtB family transcription factor n=1 Tax=Rhizobium sp. EC-SD404 TaxID=2038389 RepID=UPI00125F4F54|nr:metalloregulator ArsR/SmtB family transcription factor [Rhizobium sp. EC-SD404]